jgi:Ran GTPase-activating protein (RanGAP) involved in mRNA processing and transport
MIDRFGRILPLLRRNDPIINCLNMALIDLSDDMTSVLVSALDGNTFINKVVFQENHMSLQSCKKVFDLLLTNPKLTSLEMTDNQVGDEGMEYLSSILRRLPPGREPISLILRKNCFGPKGATHLAAALRENCPLCWLDLRYNPGVTDEGVEQLALALATNTNLDGLDLILCGCGEIGAYALADALSENTTLATLLLQDQLSLSALRSLGSFLESPSCRLESLYLWSCGLNDKVDVLCRCMRDNRSITTLALSYNKIPDAGGLYLSDMVLRNRSLVKLHLGANRFSPTAAAFLGVALGKNSTLQYLDLSRNVIRAIGVWPLAVSLTGNRTLRTIDLRYNGIDHTGAEMLCELISSSAIAAVRLSGNHFGDIAVKMIAERLRTNVRLRELELNDVEMSSDGFVAVCKALKENRTLEKISMSENQVAQGALEAFAVLLKENSTLITVGLRDCGIALTACEHIADGLAANSTLAELEISKNGIEVTGLVPLLEALRGNYALLRIEWAENPFTDDPGSQAITAQIQDILERNNYYGHNILMKDMASLVTDGALM